MCVPELSMLWHPFTVLKLQNYSNESSASSFSILFRATGPFTVSLSNRLLKTSKPKQQSCALLCGEALSEQLPRHLHPPPTVLVDGFFKGPDRLKQALRHDAIIIIAGGIGITAYLTLLDGIKHSLKRQSTAEADDGTEAIAGIRLRQLDLFWICRDAGLIDYIVMQYLSFNEMDFTGVQIRIRIYKTNKAQAIKMEHCGGKFNLNPLLSLPSADRGERTVLDLDNYGLAGLGSPMTPSYMASKCTISGNVLRTVVFGSITLVGVFFVWLLYSKVQNKHVMSTRLWILIIIVTISAFVPISREGYLQQKFPKKEIRHCQRQYDTKTTNEKEVDEEVEEKVALEGIEGRPVINNLIVINDEIQSAGIFMCGPVSMMESIKDAVRKKNSHDCNNLSRYTIYGESFEV
uniref:Ferric reductase NAD binding domain-containing protein n=1 Tax=Proboscia inermis TaxID=420281 RepID=A0A7S0CAQ6_9STRA